MYDSNEKLIQTIFISGCAMAIYYITSLVLTPFITENVGVDAYGFVTLSKNFATYAGVFTIALNSYAVRYIAVSYHGSDMEKSSIYFNSVFWADVILGIIFLTLFSLISLRPECILNVPSSLTTSVKVLLALTGVNFCITTIGAVFGSAIYIKNQLALTGIFKGISYVVEAVILILLFYSFKAEIWYVAIGSISFTVIILFTNIFLHKKYTPELKINKNVSASAIKELVVNGVWNSINSLGNILNSGLDILVSNILLSSLAMGQVAVVKTISGIFYALLQTVSQPFQPIFLKYYSNKNINNLIGKLKVSAIISGLFANLAFAGFFSLGKTFYDLWIPTQNTQLIWELTVISLFGSLVEGAVFPLYYVYTLTVKNKIPCMITVAGGILNVMSMFFLIKYTSLGIYAIVLTTTVIMTAINLIFNPLYICHCLSIRRGTFYPVILRHCLSGFVMSVAFYVIENIIKPVTWFALILTGFLDVLIGVLIHMAIQGECRKIVSFIIRRKSYE